MDSDQEDMSDEEFYLELTSKALRRPRTIRIRPYHFNIFGDADFFQRFRMSKKSAYSILELIGYYIKNPTTCFRNHSLSGEHMLPITLRVYATGGMLKTIGDVYGVSTSTVSKVVGNVTHYIAQLRNRFIVFPQTSSQLSKKKEFLRHCEISSSCCSS